MDLTLSDQSIHVDQLETVLRVTVVTGCVVTIRRPDPLGPLGESVHEGLEGRQWQV